MCNSEVITKTIETLAAERDNALTELLTSIIGVGWFADYDTITTADGRTVKLSMTRYSAFVDVWNLDGKPFAKTSLEPLAGDIKRIAFKVTPITE